LRGRERRESHDLVQLARARLENAGQVKQRAGHLAVRRRRGEHDAVAQLGLQPLGQPRAQHQGVAPLAGEEAPCREILRHIAHRGLELRPDALEQDRAGVGGRADQAVDQHAGHRGGHARYPADRGAHGLGVGDHDVARPAVPVSPAVHQDVAPRGAGGLAQHAAVGVVVDTQRHEHQGVAQGDRRRHDQGAPAVAPQVAPSHPPEHQVRPAIVGAGVMRAARSAGHSPLSAATTSITRIGCTTFSGVRTK
jgi:hypothetical protein